MPQLSAKNRSRPKIAFLDAADVFEDFYPHYGVNQLSFARSWVGSGNHAFLTVLQDKVGDVTWYALSLRPELSNDTHEKIGCNVAFFKSSLIHRCLWKLFYLPKNAWRWRRFYRYYATPASYLAPLSIKFLWKLYRDRPDILFVQSYSTGRFDVLILIARALHIPLVARHAGGNPDEYLGRPIKRWTIPRANRFIVSYREENNMLRDCYNVQPERLAMILTPIDTNTYRPRDRAYACAVTGLDSSKRYLLFVGRLDNEMKRVEVIIRCFSSVMYDYQDTDLLIIGDGEDRAMLQALAAEYASGRVHFKGWISDPEIKAAYYSLAETTLLASRREGFPAVVGESMACGTPMLSTNVGGVSELTQEGITGWLVPPGDVTSFRDKMDYLLRHPEAVAALRPNARRMAEEHVSPDAIGAALHSCFFAALENHD